jgi:hypothetical protein
MRAKLRRVLASGLLGSMTARARPGASNMIGRVQWELIEPLDDKRGRPSHRPRSIEL